MLLNKYLMVIDYYMFIYKVFNDYKFVYVFFKDMKVDGICIDFCWEYIGNLVMFNLNCSFM